MLDKVDEQLGRIVDTIEEVADFITRARETVRAAGAAPARDITHIEETAKLISAAGDQLRSALMELWHAMGLIIAVQVAHQTGLDIARKHRRKL